MIVVVIVVVLTPSWCHRSGGPETGVSRSGPHRSPRWGEEDVRRAHLHDAIVGLRRPLLVMHSPTDDPVGIAHASDILTAARHPRSFVSLEGSDHRATCMRAACPGVNSYMQPS